VFVHDIFDKDNYFVQIPGYVVDQLASGEKKTRKKAKEDLDNRNITKDSDDVVTDSAPIKGTVPKKKISTTGTQLQHRKVTEPLFPEGGPKAEHIQQRELANCYFLSVLGSMALQYPALLQNMMTDNGDTVTVRFYRKDDDSYQQESVTVKKSVAKGTTTFGTRGSGKYSATHIPWPALATKAYAAWSGHAKAGLPGFGGTYEATAYGHASVVFEHVLGANAQKKEMNKSFSASFDEDISVDDRSLIPPGHPNHPELLPWDAKLSTKFQVYLHKSKSGLFAGYLADQDDATPEQKFMAFIKEKITDPMGMSLEDVNITVNQYGSKAIIEPVLLMTKVIKNLGEADANKWITWINDGSGAKIQAAGKVGKADGVVDRAALKGFLKEAGISPTGAAAILEYSRTSVIGTAGDVNYRPQDTAMHDKIKQHIENGGMVNSGTPDYGKKGGGISGGEDTVSVPGIAGGHAYTVIGAFTKGERRFVKLGNPWGNTGMGYNNDYSKKKKISSGTFDLELSDFVRYYNNVYYSTAEESAFQVGDIGDQAVEVDE
jgi:hypothetical protein